MQESNHLCSFDLPANDGIESNCGHAFEIFSHSYPSKDIPVSTLVKTSEKQDQTHFAPLHCSLLKVFRERMMGTQPW